MEPARAQSEGKIMQIKKSEQGRTGEREEKVAFFFFAAARYRFELRERDIAEEKKKTARSLQLLTAANLKFHCALFEHELQKIFGIFVCAFKVGNFGFSDK